MRNTTSLTLATFLGLALAACVATAQSEKPNKPQSEAEPAATESKAPKQPPQPFLLTVTITESDAGKPSAEKTFVVTLIADDSHGTFESLREGDRIPFTSEKGPEYHTVGANIDFREASRLGENLVVKMTLGNNTLSGKINTSLPPDHDWRVSLVGVLAPGKPTLVYSATDAISGHKVEIEATAKLLNDK
jgi:glucose/arabinose dehydrogenase